MNKFYPVYTLQNECYDCYKCVRHCPVKAIKIEDGHASVISEKCIACGLCIKVCPQKAKQVRDDILKAKQLLKEKNEVYVSLAPSFLSAFDVPKKNIIAALKALGFAGVSETAIGAQTVSIETAKILKSNDKGLFVSSACPAIVDYIRFYDPAYTDCITKLLSPALAHAKYLKEVFSEDVGIVFIGPCASKKNEADRHPHLLDAALTFLELKKWLEEKNIDLKTIKAEEDEHFVPKEAFEGNFYPIEGGMNETIKRCDVKNARLLNISSLPAFKEALNAFDIGKIEEPVFIEALACSGGCINGPCLAEKKSGITAMVDVLAKTKTREKIPMQTGTDIFENYQAHKTDIKEFAIEDILKKMKSIGKHDIKDELNCGGCGYDTCRQLATALLKNEAETSMCTSYMRKIAAKKAGAMLRCMPSGIVMINHDFNIIETNESFIKMFAPELKEAFLNREDGIAGAKIAKILPCMEIFMQAMNSGKDIHKERYSINERLYNITAFTVEAGQIIGTVFADVTKSEIKRDEIAKKAQDVIRKNITTVQEIACLLGEHMVDTELILNSIAEDN